MRQYTGFLKGFKLIIAVMVALLAAQEETYAAKRCPCDIFKDGGTPCVAAHSVIRSLYSTYNGPLYQVRRTSDTTIKKDIYPVTAGGYANVTVVDSFFKGTTGGTVSKIYDQSEKKNDLTVSLWGSARTYPENETPATRYRDTISRHIVYPLYMESGEGYRNNHTNGVATGAQPEGMYVVASGTHVNNGCCWDYGNAESDAEAGGKRTGVMEALYFGTSCWFSPCNGSGPWMFADLEWGLFQGTATNGTTNTSLPYEYVAGYLKGDKTTYTIRAADATVATLKLMGSTDRPAPNILTGAVILGIGGDSAPSGRGAFFEGAMTIGRPVDSIEDAVQKDISLVYSHKDTIATVGAYSVAEKSPAPPQAIARYNPTTGSAVINYVLQDAARVSLTILDQRGRQIAALVNGVRPAGRNEVVWESGRFPAGVYIWKMIADGREGGAGKIVVGK